MFQLIASGMIWLSCTNQFVVLLPVKVMIILAGFFATRITNIWCHSELIDSILADELM